MLSAPLSPANLRFLQTWQRWEGGHTNNDATYNWLNTTQDAPGAVRSINSVGVKAFDNQRNGINALASTLLNGRYDDIVKALRAGDPYSHDVSAGLQTWVSGRPDGNPAYAQKVLGGAGVPKAALPAGGRGSARKPDLAPAPDPGLAPELEIAFDDDPEFLSLLRKISDARAQKAGLVDPKGSVRPVKPSGNNADVIHVAQTQLGKPYVFGSGPSTESFDCSDLIQWAYKQVGVELPRTTFDQINAGKAVSWKNLKPGDLIFPTNHHVVMYVGNGKVIAAPHTGTVVQYQPVSRFKNPVAIRRVR